MNDRSCSFFLFLVSVLPGEDSVKISEAGSGDLIRCKNRTSHEKVPAETCKKSAEAGTA